MKLKFKIASDLVLVDKPAGFSTHSPDTGKLGLCEIFEKELGTKLYVVHRLDKSTTGALVFARTPETATELIRLFEARKVEKKYVFVTDRSSQEDFHSVSTPLEAKEAKTLFRRLKRSPFFELWEARPQTGRQHQIRIHAAEIGLPILGDVQYGGSEFPHLCLHSEELKIPGMEAFISPLPLFMQRMGLLKDPLLVQSLSHLDRRQRLYDFLNEPEESLRLVHSTDFRADMFGSQIWFYWYKESVPTAKDLERVQFIAQLLQKEWLLRRMQNRGEDPNSRQVWTSENWKSTWTAKENGISFGFRSDLGQSPGLFLDQRRNRLRIRNLSKHKKVLNLFAYTCGFSLSAACGEASEVVSVDLSSPFLKWGQDNFNLNRIDSTLYEFFQQESQVFLKGALKRGRQFDVIVCDPPSFGRHKGGVFRLEEDLTELLRLCFECLAPGGKILFSCNFEKWDRDELKKRIFKVLRNVRIDFEVPDWDYEIPNEEALLKSFWITQPS